MRLLLYHPEWDRSCSDCQAWIFDDDGKVARRPARIGLPIRRPPGAATPCWKCPKVPEDAPTRTRRHAIEMTPQSLACYEHYLECKAVGVFPDDPIVRRMAGLIRRLEDGHGRNQVVSRLDALIALITAGGVRHG